MPIHGYSFLYLHYLSFLNLVTMLSIETGTIRKKHSHFKPGAAGSKYTLMNTKCLNIEGTWTLILCRFLILFKLSNNDTRSRFSQGTEPKFVFSHKLLPRSPTMAFSSVRENVTPNTQLEIVLENVIVHYILLIMFNFILYFITLLWQIFGYLYDVILVLWLKWTKIIILYLVVIDIMSG